MGFHWTKVEKRRGVEKKIMEAEMDPSMAFDAMICEEKEDTRNQHKTKSSILSLCILYCHML